MVGALLLSLTPVVALALNVIKCGGSGDRNNDPVICAGTNNAEEIRERDGTVQDEIRGLGGADIIKARQFNSDKDEINAGSGGDTLYTDDNDTRDRAGCNDGNDTAYITVVYDSTGKITEADEVSNCETVKAKDPQGNTVTLDQSKLPQNQTSTTSA